MVAYSFAYLGDLGASSTPRVRRLFSSSNTTIGYTSVEIVVDAEEFKQESAEEIEEGLDDVREACTPELTEVNKILDEKDRSE